MTTTFDTQTGGIALDCVFHTPDGLVPLDWLQPGDLIETQDRGFQPIERISRCRDVTQVVELGGGVLAGQRLLVAGWPIEMYFGHGEGLCMAGDAAPIADRHPKAEFAQIVMDAPSVLRMGEIWIESHGGGRACLPVFNTQEMALVKRAFGCPLVRGAGKSAANAEPVVPSTFGSHVAAA